MSEVLTLSVPSQSDAKLTYTMHVCGDEITCSCRGFNSHKHCKHQDALRRVFKEERMTEEESSTAVATREYAPPPAIVVGNPGTAMLPSRDDMRLMTDIAKTVFAAGGEMVPKHIKTPYQALAVMIAGHELGLRPMTALRHVYIVNGKTEIETRAMVGIVKARDSRIQFEWPEYTSDAVTCVIKRPGQTPVAVRYTREDAKASGQMKPGPWTSYTRDMLYAAATKRAVRLAAPDIINAIDSGMQHTVIEAEINDVTPESDLLADAAPPDVNGIPADAYNEGDDPGGYAPGLTAEEEAAVPAQQPPAPSATPASGVAEHNPRRDVAMLLTEMRETTDKEFQERAYDALRREFPEAFPGGTRYVANKLAEEDARALAGRMRTALGGEPPAAASDAEAEQGALDA
jgi:hypothetical protein